MWSTTYLGMYRPLTWMTYAIDYDLWALDPFGYHLTSLVLHVTGGAVFYLVAVQLFGLANPQTTGGTTTLAPRSTSTGGATLIQNLCIRERQAAMGRGIETDRSNWSGMGPSTTGATLQS
jgi:hypothetical protein